MFSSRDDEEVDSTGSGIASEISGIWFVFERQMLRGEP